MSTLKKVVCKCYSFGIELVPVLCMSRYVIDHTYMYSSWNYGHMKYKEWKAQRQKLWSFTHTAFKPLYSICIHNGIQCELPHKFVTT